MGKSRQNRYCTSMIAKRSTNLSMQCWGYLGVCPFSVFLLLLPSTEISKCMCAPRIRCPCPAARGSSTFRRLWRSVLLRVSLCWLLGCPMAILCCLMIHYISWYRSMHTKSVWVVWPGIIKYCRTRRTNGSAAILQHSGVLSKQKKCQNWYQDQPTHKSKYGDVRTTN